MSERWVQQPRLWPKRCHHSNQDDAEHGPYFELERTVPTFHGGQRRDARLYLSAGSVRGMLAADGSPFVPVTQEEWAALERQHEDQAERIGLLEGQVEELQRQLEERDAEVVAVRQERVMLSDEQLARVADRLAERLPKPDAPAPAPAPASRSPRGRAA